MKIPFSQIESAENAAMEWLCNAYSNGKGGFPHSRWIYLPSGLAWNRDYAETTGYLIENLVEFNKNAKSGLSHIAATTGNWLLSIQSKEGYFHSGTQFIKPSAFNTAQVLFGFDTLYSHTKDEKYFIALSKAFHWLIKSIDENGILHKGLYVKDYFPAYYSRAIWPLILVDQKYFDSRNEMKLFKSLNHLFSYKNETGFFNDTGFYPHKHSSLHTVVYTLEGFYECAKLTNDNSIKSYIYLILDQICTLIQQHQKTPAYFYPNLKADYSFVCITGQAQLCALLLKVHLDNVNPIYKSTAILLFKQLLNWQIKSNSPEHHGAFPSCMPIWKNYFPFRYTNWTMKFFLDACMMMKRTN